MKAGEAVRLLDAGNEFIPGVYRIRFTNKNGEEDETELDLFTADDLAELWEDLHDEMDAAEDSINSIEIVFA